MKVLVTGGDGFIGRHLVKRLRDEGNKVTVVDIKSGSNILEDIETLFNGVDVVFHLAALTRPRESFVNPVETNRVNVEGTLKILLHCRNKSIKRVVFVSSATVYGFQNIFPFSEGATLNPASPYGLTKLLGEQYCRLFAKLYDMEINYIRPFNVYGVGQNPEGSYGAAIPKFIDALRNRKTPRITGDGKQARDFIYIDDLIELMIRLSISIGTGGVFNAGSGKSTSINDLYKIISGIMKKKVTPRYVKEIIEPETQADISKARELLLWEPKVSLEEGLRRTIEGTLS